MNILRFQYLFFFFFSKVHLVASIQIQCKLYNIFHCSTLMLGNFGMPSKLPVYLKKYPTYWAKSCVKLGFISLSIHIGLANFEAQMWFKLTTLQNTLYPILYYQLNFIEILFLHLFFIISSKTTKTLPYTPTNPQTTSPVPLPNPQITNQSTWPILQRLVCNKILNQDLGRFLHHIFQNSETPNNSTKSFHFSICHCHSPCPHCYPCHPPLHHQIKPIGHKLTMKHKFSPSILTNQSILFFFVFNKIK